MSRRWALILSVAVLMVAFAAVATGLVPKAATFRADVLTVASWRRDHPVATAVLYFSGYVAVTAFSLPLSIWMSLGAGAVFGFAKGLVIAALAATLGATCAFLFARYLFRDIVEARAGGRLSAIRSGLDRDGAMYLFSLRLIPAVPFFLVNLTMGLTRLPVRTFFWVSLIGMLPASAVYVNAGTQLSQIGSLRDVMSVPVIVSLAALGALPWVLRSVMRRVHGRAVYARWRRPGRFDRNLIVIGGGAAGLVSAYVASALKARVTLVEQAAMGGDCLNTGCVPSKALIRSARMAHQMRNADRYGLAPAEPKIAFGDVMARLRRVIAEIEPHDSATRYRGLGVEVLQGRARIADPWTVVIETETGRQSLTTRAIIVATGASPVIPGITGLEKTGYLTTETMWDALAGRDEVPKRLAILGGGPVGCELAQAFARLGSAVTLVEAEEQILRREDPEVAACAKAALAADGVVLRLGQPATACDGANGEKWIVLGRGGDTQQVVFDDLIVAVGREARLTGLGLEELGIPVAKTIGTGDYLETIYPNIYAAGDVAGPHQFTHAASHQAWLATANALLGPLWRFRADSAAVPSATFIDPEIARVGLNEREAKAAGIRYDVTRYGLDDLDRAIADGSAQGFVKVLTYPGSDRILGVTIVGEHAADLLAEFVFAMRHGMGLKKILSTIHIYPTLSEANKHAAGVWRRAHVNGMALSLMARYHRWRRGGTDD